MEKNNPSETRTLIPSCSFCGKGQDTIKRLIPGPGGVYICDECIELCHEEEQAHAQESAGEPKAQEKREPICSSCGASLHYCFNCGAPFTQKA